MPSPKRKRSAGNAAQVKYWLETGLSYHADDPRLLKRISLVYLNEQNYNMAIHYLDRLLAVDPENASALRNRGIAYYQKRDKARAREDFEKVRSSTEGMKGLYGPLAECYRETGAVGKSLEVIKEGIAAGSQEAWLYSVWGKILEDGKKL